MPIFYYRATDPTGNIIQGSLEAREERLVVQHLQQGGLIPLRITGELDTQAWPKRLPLARRRLSLNQVLHFTQELAALLKAGLPLDRSLKALRTVTRRPAMQTILSQLLQDLQAGKSLSEALSRHKVFSPLYLSVVRAGETGGFLEVSLSRLTDYLKTVSELRGYLFSALIYPVILALVGSLSVVVMLVYVVPRFELFFQEMGQSLFWTTRVLLWCSQAFRAYWWLGGLLIALAGLVAIRLSRTPRGRLGLDRLKLQAPLVGSLTRQVTAAFFAKTLGTLLNNGVPLVAALQVVIDTVTNRYLAQSFSGVLEEVKKGQPLSGLLKKTDVFPELFLQMIAIGEETGHLSEMLLSAADSLETEARAGVRRLLALLEPVLILTMALLVAFIIVSLLLPILNLYEVSF
ncbi:MAG: type II secretion system F family protein [Desulfobacteraceae bacterium]